MRLLHHNLRSLIERPRGTLDVENHAAHGVPAAFVRNRMKSTVAVCNSRRRFVLGDASRLFMQRLQSALQRLHHSDWADMMHWIHCNRRLRHVLMQVVHVRLLCWLSVFCNFFLVL